MWRLLACSVLIAICAAAAYSATTHNTGAGQTTPTVTETGDTR